MEPITYTVQLTQEEIEIIIKSIECAGYYKAMSPITAKVAGDIIEKLKNSKSS